MTTMMESRKNGFTTEEPVDPDFARLMHKPMASRPPHEELAAQLGIPANQICGLLKQSIMPRETSDADFLAFLQVCARYRLNPLLREIYPMPKKGGGIVPIVGIDGWCSIIQREKRFDGCSFRYIADDEGNLEMVFCTMYVKGQTHPVEIGERMNECARGTDPWKQMPYRMLRHRAYMQAARIAFGVHGICDEDEGMQIAGYANVEEGFNALMASKKGGKENPFRKPAEPAGDTSAPQQPTEAVSPEQPAHEPQTGNPGNSEAGAPARVQQATPAAPVDPRTPEDIAEEFAENTSEDDMRAALQRAATGEPNIKKRYEHAKAIAQVTTIPGDMELPDLRAVFYNFKLAELTAPAAKSTRQTHASNQLARPLLVWGGRFLPSRMLPTPRTDSMSYQVLNWNEHFENNKSRERTHCSYVCVPNKQDGLGLQRLLAEPDGAAIYGIFNLILGACSKQKARDGHLTDTGRAPSAGGVPWTLEDMALLWRRPVAEIQHALDVLCSAKVGWIKEIDDKCPPSARVVPAECPLIEENRREENRREQNTSGAAVVAAEVDGIVGLPKATALTPEAPDHEHFPPRDPRFTPNDVTRILRAYPRQVAIRRAQQPVEYALCELKHRGIADPVGYLLQRVQLFAASKAGNKGDKTPNPATWFDDARYDDDPAEWNKGGTAKEIEEAQKSQKIKTRDKALDDARKRTQSELKRQEQEAVDQRSVADIMRKAHREAMRKQTQIPPSIGAILEDSVKETA
jgi:phage recombination protein Bet